MKKINEHSTVALDDAIFNFAEALTHILAVNLSMLYDDVDNDEDSTVDFDEEAEKRTINVYKFAAGADGKVGKDEIFTCQCLAQQFNSDDSRSRYYNYLAEDLGAHLERIWLECEDEDEFVDAATQLLRGLVAAAQFTDAGRLDGGEKRKMLNQINKLVEAYVLAGGGMGVNENTKVTLTLGQIKRLVKESLDTVGPAEEICSKIIRMLKGVKDMGYEIKSPYAGSQIRKFYQIVDADIQDILDLRRRFGLTDVVRVAKSRATFNVRGHDAVTVSWPNQYNVGLRELNKLIASSPKSYDDFYGEEDIDSAAQWVALGGPCVYRYGTELKPGQFKPGNPIRMDKDEAQKELDSGRFEFTTHVKYELNWGEINGRNVLQFIEWDDADDSTTVSEDDEGPADVDAAIEDLFDMYRACKVEPKVCNAITADGKKTNIFLDRGNSVGGIARALRDGRLLKVIGFN